MSGSRTAIGSIRENPPITKDNIVIAVMGVTGVGKSTFINYFSDESVLLGGEAVVGHTLESCTAEVQVFASKLPDGTKLYLVDTPGFDDTYTGDTDTLEELAGWLNEAYSNKVKLTGIVYLHRIADNRMPGAGMKTLRMFQALCGDNGLKSVVLATTHWSRSGHQLRDQLRRETQLQENPRMWGRMTENGSKVMRHDEAQHSALKILEYLINLHRPFHTRISEEMAGGKKLSETTAGHEIFTAVEKQRIEYEEKIENLRREMREALRKKDIERQEEIDQKMAEFEVKQNEMRENERKLQADAKQLQQQREEEHRRRREELEDRLRISEDTLRIEQMRLEQLRRDNHYALEIERYRLKLEEMRKERDRYKIALIRERMPACTVM